MPAYRARMQVDKRHGETIVNCGNMSQAAKLAIRQAVAAHGSEPEEITLVISSTPTTLTWAEDGDVEE